MINKLHNGHKILKIADLGSSKDLKLECIKETINDMYSVGYRAPEVIDENPEPSEPSWIKVDMWALGIILY